MFFPSLSTKFNSYRLLSSYFQLYLQWGLDQLCYHTLHLPAGLLHCGGAHPLVRSNWPYPEVSRYGWEWSSCLHKSDRRKHLFLSLRSSDTPCSERAGCPNALTWNWRRKKQEKASEKDESERENALEICKVLCCFAGYWLVSWKSASPYTL